jgi:hypothetical protein
MLHRKRVIRIDDSDCDTPTQVRPKEGSVIEVVHLELRPSLVAAAIAPADAAPASTGADIRLQEHEFWPSLVAAVIAPADDSPTSAGSATEHRKLVILIDDSDCDTPTQVHPQAGSVTELVHLELRPLLVAATIAPADDPPTTAGADIEMAEQELRPSLAAANIAPAHAAPVMQMNRYFQQFPACGHCALEPALLGAAPDAEVMDLRAAVPPDYSRYMDLESKHMGCDSDDSSGSTGSDGSSAGSSFIDDSPIELTTAESAYIAEFASEELPRTAALLLSQPSRHSRRIVISSSSSSDGDGSGAGVSSASSGSDNSDADSSPAAVTEASTMLP